MKSEKTLKEIAKRDAKRFCKRNKVYETYDGSVADMIKKLYITTYLRARHQIMSEVNQKTPEGTFENAKNFPNNSKVIKEENPRACYVEGESSGYKSWDELTQMDRAIYKLTGGKMINCYWDFKRSPDKPLTPVIREVKDQKDRSHNDRITYVVGPRFVNVWYFSKDEGHSKIKEMNILADDVKDYMKQFS